MRGRTRLLRSGIVALALGVAPSGAAIAQADGVGPGREPVPAGFAPTIRVPQDAPTIQEAVDRAQPGGMVLVSAGVYREAVTVTTPFLTIRGLDRNRTILDGGLELPTGIRVIEADGVTIENLTARRFRLSGFQWSSVFGYWGSHLTALDNGGSGVSVSASVYGQLDHSYASGALGSGFSIGRCQPCHALITDVLAERNPLGFSGRNAGGRLVIVNSEWRGNLAGIALDTLDREGEPPQRAALIAGNHVHDNNGTMIGVADDPARGIGILVSGGVGNLVVGNLVEDHAAYGIALLPSLDGNVWVTADNTVRANVVRRSGRADLALGAPSSGGDCFEGNDFDTSAPPAIETLYGCDGPSLAAIGGGDPAPTVTTGGGLLDALDAAPRSDLRRRPAPPPQPSMQAPAQAPPHPAVPEEAVPQTYRIRDRARIASASGPRVGREISVMGIPLAASWWSLILGLYGYLLPFVLYAAWVSVALWDLVRREGTAIPRRSRWMVVVLLVPFLGPVLYFAFGGSPIPRQLRLMIVVGGMGAYAVIVILGALLGG
jgi:hypothetical protein